MEFNFYNTLLTALAVPEKGITNFKLKKGVNRLKKKQVEITRRHLLGCQQFAVSDNLLRHAVMASKSNPKTLLKMASIAIPPFENMFIEWNETKRRAILNDFGILLNHDLKDDETHCDTPIVGYHIFKRKNQYQFEMYFTVDDEELDIDSDQVSLPTMAMIFNPEGEASMWNDDDQMLRDKRYNEIFPDDATKAQNLKKVIENKQHRMQYGGWLLGVGYSCLHGVPQQMLQTKAREELFALDGVDKDFKEICNRIALDDRPSANILLGKQSREDFNVMSSQEKNLSIHGGDMRFLIALLALINYPHILVKRDQIDTGLKTRAFGRKLLKKEVKVLEINLPKPRGVTQYERMFKGYGSPKRQHVRRGHFRIIKHKDNSTSTKWISEQTVGDPKLGFIDHKYLLTHKNV